MKRIVILFLLVFSVQLYASEDKALLWQAKSKTATVYLFGSIHFADKSFYPLRKEIEHAFNESDALVVEINMDDAAIAAYQRIVESEGTYGDGKTIEEHISKKTYADLKRGLKKLGVPIEFVNKQKPGVVVVMLATLQAMSMGLDPTLGIDLYFLDKAKEKKEIIALETIEEQLDIFINMPSGDLILRESLHSMEESEKIIKEMVEAWKQGDEDKMHQLFFEDALEEHPEFSSIYDTLIFNRNKKMTKKIQSYLKTKKTYFVVIGAGHFLGEKGIISLLENTGYKIKRL